PTRQRWVHRIRTAFIRAPGSADAREALPAGPAPRADRERGGEAVRDLAIDARAEHQEHPGFLGEGGAQALSMVALLRRKRFWRHADQREHLDFRGGDIRAISIPVGSPPADPRSGPPAGTARHALSYPPPVRAG